jgi:hypothetical protein
MQADGLGILERVAPATWRTGIRLPRDAFARTQEVGEPACVSLDWHPPERE